MLMTSELKSVNDIVIIKLCEVSVCDESKRSKHGVYFLIFSIRNLSIKAKLSDDFSKSLLIRFSLQ